MRCCLVLGLGLTLGACSDFTGVEDSGSTGADASGSTSSTPSGGGEGSSAPGSTTSDDDTTTGGVTTDDDPSSPETTDPTNDPTDADTETSGKDPTTGDSSTGEPPPSDCGDGVEQPGEACDDGNQDELDGCTSACVIGPLALDFGPQTQTAKEGGGSNTQIQTFVDTCPDPQVLVGLSGGLSSEGWIGVIRGECQDGRIDNADPTTFRTTGPINQLPPRGQFDQDGPWGTQCPANQAIIAVRGGAGDVMDGLEVECAEVATVGSPGAYSLETSSTGWQPLQGSAGGGDFGPLRCPDGSVATGVDTDTNSYVIRIRLLCRPVDLQYP